MIVCGARPARLDAVEEAVGQVPRSYGRRRDFPTNIAQMTATPPGWYPDPSGKPGLRYFDGTTWRAEEPQPPHLLSDEQRAEVLNQALMMRRHRGARVESHNTPFSAVVVWGRPTARVLSSLLSLGDHHGERREFLEVDRYGHVSSDL